MLNVFARARVGRVTDPIGRWLRGPGSDPRRGHGRSAPSARSPPAVWFLPTRAAVRRHLVVTVFVLFDLARRRDGPGPRAAARRSARCSTPPATGSADGAIFAGARLVVLGVGDNRLARRRRAALPGRRRAHLLHQGPRRGRRAHRGRRDRRAGRAADPGAGRHRPRRARGRRTRSVAVALLRRARRRALAPWTVRRSAWSWSHRSGRDGPSPAARLTRPRRTRRPVGRRLRRRLAGALRALPGAGGRAAPFRVRRRRRRAAAAGRGVRAAAGQPGPGRPRRRRPAELDALVRAGLRSYARYWCEAFRLPRWTRRGSHARMDAARARGGPAARRAGRRARRGLRAAAQRQLGRRRGLAGRDCAGSVGPRSRRSSSGCEPESLYRRFVAYRERWGSRSSRRRRRRGRRAPGAHPAAARRRRRVPARRPRPQRLRRRGRLLRRAGPAARRAGRGWPP